jgi:peptidoglycan hydrolase-like protein with peptidoglycan-binding domain
MSTIRKSEHTAPSSPQRAATKPESGKPASGLESKPAAAPVGHPDVSRFTSARSRPLVALQAPDSAAVGRVALSAQAQGGGAAEPERIRTTDFLNLRAVATTEGNTPLTTLDPGTELEVTPDAEGVTRKNGFVHVAWSQGGVRQEGWVAEQFTTPVAPARPVPPGTTPGSSEGLSIPQVSLRLGDTGPAVRQLQECLVTLGHMTQAQVDAAAGTFDTATQEAVRAFQVAQGIEPVAIFGPKTRAAMHQALGVPQPLGALSQKYESNGNPGAVSSGEGDPGGVSYGAYQFATNPGSAQTFVNWLADTYPDYHAALSGKAPGTEEFSAAWRELAARDPSGFLEAQHDHIQSKFYEPARTDVARALGLDVSTRSQALQDALWSTAVQHGPGGALRVFQLALAGKDVSQLSDADIIRALYAERGRKNEDGTLVHFSNSSPAVQRSVAQRFIDEERDALAMLEASGGQ